MVFELTSQHLSVDDFKVLKHLRAINNLFKKGCLTINQLFVDNGNLAVTKIEDGLEYKINTFYDIDCDGGDPDRFGKDGLYSPDELEEYYENKLYLLTP